MENALPALAGLTMLAAMGLLGVGVLRRWTRLDGLESLAYGVTLGVVACSTALVPLATWLGLRTRVIAGLALVAVALGAALLRAARRRPVGGREATPAIGIGAALVMAAFIARWALLCASALTVDAQGLQAGHVHLWGDWPHHLIDVSCFAYGDNFPPTHPRFAGHPLSYHYLASLTVAAMVRLGLTPIAAMPLHSFVFMSLTTLGVFAFARRLTRDSAAAALALTLFLIGGGLGWVLALRHAWSAPHPWQALWADPWDTAAQWTANFRWLDTVFAYLAPQRAVLYGLPLAMLALTLLWDGVRKGGWRDFVIAGLATGLLPLANLGAMLALALVTPFLVLAFPRRGWVAFFPVWAALAVPVFLAQQGGGGALRLIHWQVGWIAKPDAWWFFWLKNLGAFVPLLLWSLADREVVPKPAPRFLWAFMPVFAIANLVVFQPWDWDNTKVLLYWFLATCILAASTLLRMWRAGGRVTRVLLALVFATLVFSALLVHLEQALGRDRHLLLTTNELKVAEATRRVTPPHALFLAGLQHNHPIPMLAGRRLVMSYPGWLWSQGIDSAARERDVRDIYAMDPGWESKLAAYRVDYLVIGPWEREHFHPDEAAFAARFARVVDLPPYAVYQVRAPR